MQKFFRFWKKDFINKLITLVVLLIAAAVAIDLYLLTTPRSAGSSLLEDLFPTPTTELKVIQTRIAETAAYQAAMATASVPPTMTTMPFTPRPRTATFTPTAIAPTSTMTPIANASALTPEAAPQTTEPAAGAACIPNAPAQKGKAVDILDGYTIKVLIDGLVYTVRYIGIELPEDEAYAGTAEVVNGRLVFGKEITLIGDDPDKDQLGRLLRYVKVEDSFVNLELIQQGLATTENIDPDLACAEVFKNAEQSAREARQGLWKTAP